MEEKKIYTEEEIEQLAEQASRLRHLYSRTYNK